MFISHHSYAVEIEHIMRNVFKLNDRGGFGGVADADYVDDNPFSAICITLATFYNSVDNDKKILIENYISEYYFYKDITIEKIGEENIIKMITKLRKLLEKIK